MWAARRGREIGCECLQVFVRSARGWRGRVYSEREVDRFRGLLSQHGTGPVIAHSCYLVNLASPQPDLLARSGAAVADDLRRAALLGGRVVCVHAGNHMGAGVEAGLRTLATSVRGLLETGPDGVELLLENAAGRGREIGGRWQHFARLLELLDGDERVGMCFDTCHAHAAGYRLDSPRWVTRSLGEFAAAVGMDRLRLVHLNDSRYPAGSGRDRHEHLGKGAIGDRGLRAVLRRRDLRGRCAVLETPFDSPRADAVNIAHARKLAGRLAGPWRAGGSGVRPRP